MLRTYGLGRSHANLSAARHAVCRTSLAFSCLRERGRRFQIFHPSNRWHLDAIMPAVFAVGPHTAHKCHLCRLRGRNTAVVRRAPQNFAVLLLRVARPRLAACTLTAALCDATSRRAIQPRANFAMARAARATAGAACDQ